MSARRIRLLTAMLAVAGLGAAGAASSVLASVAEPGPTGPTTTSGPACPTYNPPSELVLVGGTPQSARLGAPFQSNLQVRLDAANGCPITTPLAGVAVTFSAPTTGPSGTFASSGSNAVVVGTDSSGVASAPQFTADTLPGGYLVTASSAVGSVTFSLVNTGTGVPATIRVASPESQAAVAGTRFGSPLAVRVLDGDGAPIPGTHVTFQLGGAGGTAAASANFDTGGGQATVTTGTDGVARSPIVIANDVAGAFTATAAVDGITEPARFSLRNLPAKPPRLRHLGATRQSAVVGDRYGRPLAVVVRGADGKPVAGVDVTFTLGGTGGAGGTGTSAGAGASFAGGMAQATAVTNTAGVARSPRFAANMTAGTFTATATAAGVAAPATFTLRNRAGAAATVSAGAAASESAQVGARFPVRLAVTVSDAHGNVVAEALVTFTAPPGGASGTFAHRHRHVREVTVRTNAAGVAVAPAFVANRTAGGYAVSARTTHAKSAAFALVNLP
jgi:hypothetical protein